jgi:BirA family biotin operon repressor/biotin-[acetyl-CoA-carboxylase] ligase
MNAHATAPLGTPRVHLRRTDSTNERARMLAGAGAPHGTLVTAAEQTAGRGRQGRRWSAPPGSSLLASIVLSPAPRLLPLAAAVAVCDAVDAVRGAAAAERAMIKWPNDVVLARGDGLAKLAGILIEARPQQGWAVLGIGLNAAVDLDELPADLHGTAASLELGPERIEELLGELLTALERRLAEAPEVTLAAWRRRDALQGRPISWGPPASASDEDAPGAGQSGVAQGIDGDGRLVVVLPGGGRTALGAGEVHLQPLD